MLGIPVIAHRSGGPKETIIEDKTGVFFDELTLDSLIQAIRRFETLKFNSQTIRDHAKQFSKLKFETKIKSLVNREFERKHSKS